MRFATCYWLLLSLASTGALAQTHAGKSPVRNVAPAPRTEGRRPEPWLKDEREPWPYFPEDFSQEPAVVPEPLDPDKVSTYVEQMPALLEAGGMAGLVAALTRRVVVPPTAPAGRVFVQFVVTRKDLASQPQVLRGLRADVDSAVVAAVRQLPCFLPGEQNGRPVPVSLALPVTIGAQRP